MKRYLIILACLSFKIAYGQFGIISDKDGFVNVRSSPNIGKNISDKLENGFLVYSFEPNENGNWINIQYKKNDKELDGYIYKDKIKNVTDFENIPLKSNSNGILNMGNKNVKVEISETKFLQEKHKLSYYKGSTNQLDKIDNLQIYGTDGEIPKREYKSIKVEIDNVKIELPNIAFKNLYEPSLVNSKASYDEKNDVLYIFSSNSDGAGGYEIIWVIEKKKYKYRMEAYGF